MPDWIRFREAFKEGLPNGVVLKRFRLMESWLDLRPEQAVGKLQNEVQDATTALLFYQALSVLRMKLQQEGRESDSQRMVVSRQLSNALLQVYPELGKSVSSAELAVVELRQASSPIFARLNAAAQNCSPGRVTPESIQELEQIREAYKELAGQAAPDNAALPDIFYALGHTALSLARSCAIAGRNDEARAEFEEAAGWFEKSGDSKNAADCRARGKNLGQQLSADLDAAAEPHLQLLAKSGPNAGPLERAAALAGLTDVAANAGDVFEAAQNADATAQELDRLGFTDPLKAGGDTPVDAAIDGWITTATNTLSGISLLRRLTQVGTWYCSIFNARLTPLLNKDPEAVNRVNALLTGTQNALSQLQAEAASAGEDLEREWAAYFPQMAQPRSSPPKERYDALIERMRAIDSAVLKLGQECNLRLGAGEPMEDLLQAAMQLEAQAATLNAPMYDAKTRMEHVYILLQMGRAQEILPLVQEARAMLLAGRSPSLSSFSESFERATYLDTLSKQAMAQIMLRDFEGVLKTCEDTIRDFETERYRVNSPYRQSASLSYVADFYKWAAFAAFKLERWDSMVEATELIKARSAVRSRLIPDPPEFSESDLAREFEQVSAALEENTAGDDIGDLVVRRRQLWDLLTIARTRGGTVRDLPELRLDNLQSALAQDEATIGYFWLSESTVLVMVLDRDRFHAERITFTTEQRQSLDEFVSFIQGLRGASRQMDGPVACLGAILFPKFCRDFVTGKRRLIISPHHSLHLFPFHASRYEDDFLGTRFAVRYVPNFSSLLLPWESRCENRVLAIGIRDFADPHVNPLANVEEDLPAIQASYEAKGIPVEVLAGREATRERIESMREQGFLSRFGCVHFGTHALSVFDTPDQPMESKLLLQNAALDSMDIAGLRLNAELAVLSACHSGQRAIGGRDLGELPGDDIFGLQSALFQAGVRTVLGTLWLVETTSSSAITKAFHQYNAEGHAPETALQLTIRDYLADPLQKNRGIFYWAPYFLSSLGRRIEECRN